MKKNQNNSLIQTIKNSLDHSQLLHFQYKNNQGQISQRTVEPYQLLFKENNWYLQAYCQEKNDFRIFKLARISHLITTNEFTPRIQLEALPSIKKMNPPEQTILLRVTHSLKEYLEDKFDHLSFQKIQDSHFFLVNFPFQEDDFGYHLLLSFGIECECLSPKSVRNELQIKITELLAIYQKQT